MTSRYSEWWQVVVDTYVLDERPEQLQQCMMQIDLFLITCEQLLGTSRNTWREGVYFSRGLE